MVTCTVAHAVKSNVVSQMEDESVNLSHMTEAELLLKAEVLLERCTYVSVKAQEIMRWHRLSSTNGQITFDHSVLVQMPNAF